MSSSRPRSAATRRSDGSNQSRAILYAAYKIQSAPGEQVVAGSPLKRLRQIGSELAE
jgi:hypothetical protein